MGAQAICMSQTMFHHPSHSMLQEMLNSWYLNVSGWLARIKGDQSSIIPPVASMTQANARKPGKRKPPRSASALPASGADELVLHGDISGLTYAFVRKPKRLLTCPVPDSVYLKMQGHPGGVSQFFEDAVAAFDGDLEALVNAAVLFVEHRRLKAAVDPPRNASGRVDSGTFEKVERINQALAEIRGMSRAKVVAGLIMLVVYKN